MFRDVPRWWPRWLRWARCPWVSALESIDGLTGARCVHWRGHYPPHTYDLRRP